jgi:hypothetical protein
MDSTKSAHPNDDSALQNAAYSAQLAASQPMPPANGWTQGDIVYGYVTAQLAPVLKTLEQAQVITGPLMDRLDGFPNGYIHDVRKDLSKLLEHLMGAEHCIRRINEAQNAPCEVTCSASSLYPSAPTTSTRLR